MKLGLYCGSFNPFHLGHLNIYEKACAIFDEVRICQGVNPDKKGDQDPVYDIPGVPKSMIERYEGFTHNLVRKYVGERHDVTLIRGLRNGYDYDYEMNQIQFMRDFLPELKVVLIPCDREFSHISSTAIRGLTKIAWFEANKYLPKAASCAS